MLYEIPLDSTPDQEFSINIDVDGESIPLILRLRYNTEGNFWHVDISDGKTGQMLVASAPLVTGRRTAVNLMRQFGYLGIGNAITLKVTDGADGDIPGTSNLGTDFLLLWGGRIDE